ncbi:MAG: hypothetical protein HKN74_08965 [Acidimicrobiia bacterium]|nr:hypothetical protein [Acidimicrobiia bacterium]NNF10399.1 hypothetical protein [Acidimicrobiia bacterium]NNL69420.1 hypothetical protein [Acidimicrobiia bacterium]
MQRNLAWVALALASIWISVAVISLSSPDLVYGAERDTFPLIPAVTWMSGAAATSYVLRALVVRHPSPEDQRNAWVGIALSATAIWALVTVVTLLLPTFDFNVTDDPIIIPLGHLVAPAAAAVATGIAAQYVPLLTDAAAAERRGEALDEYDEESY